RIFDRFAQVDTSSTRRHDGTGIGLALVRELVELHGGRVWAESEGTGRGTQMHVVLPEGEADSEAEEEVIQTSSGESVALGNSLAAMVSEMAIDEPDPIAMRNVELERSVRHSEPLDEVLGGLPEGPNVDAAAAEVLIVEDNPDMRKLLTFLIGKEFRVRVARNGREGLELVRESLPDLVLTDVMMPEMSGAELCRILKADSATRQVPVVLVTSKAEREMKIEGLELGADDYVTKPFHPRELMARVRSLVKLQQASKELDRKNVALESANAELRAALEELHEAGVQLVKSERLAAVGEIAAGVAHEINNPMNFAINALRTMGDYVGDVSTVTKALADIDWTRPATVKERMQEVDKLRETCDFDEATAALGELLEIVTAGLDRTQRLVGDLRGFAGPGDSVVADVDIARGLRTTVQLIGHAARDANVEVRVDIAEPLPAVAGDARALNQVFLNLFKNATAALEGQGGRLDVTAAVRGDRILVEFRDDGPGIAEGDLARVFEPFFTTKEAGRGTGLGLSISRRIVDEHGGDLELVSEEGVGSTFRVTLPYEGDSVAA
ncbi:MAG: response regulator, partial [Deltaproteobacteria bacterium]|nr:response regulator [Deltaproteobacteria bacterium]